MERLKIDRNFYLAYFIQCVPLGFIYTWVFFNDSIKALNTACGHQEDEALYDEQKSPGLLLYLIFNLITFGIYGLYWINKQGKRMTEAGRKFGIVGEFRDPERKALGQIILGYVLMIIGLVTVMFAVGFFLVVLGAVLYARANQRFFSDLNTLCIAYNKEVIDGVAASAGKLGQQVNVQVINQQPQFDNHSNDEVKQQAVVNVQKKPINVAASTEGGVTLVSGEYAGSTIKMKDGEKIVIGRDPAKCALVCSSNKISRVHLTIEYRVVTAVSSPNSVNAGRFYRVTDTSTNGTVSSESGKLPRGQAVTQHSGTFLELGSPEEKIRLL